MTQPIIQFGTSRFLQAHADLFISDAMAEGQDVGPVTVVQTTGSAERAGRLAAFDGRPIPVVVRGLENGVPVERTEYTRSIVRGLSSATDWPEVVREFSEKARYAISNTGDTGYRMPEGETVGEGVPKSFPAKLTALLHARWRDGSDPITLFPCELIPKNGVVLSTLCAEIALRSGLSETFVAWLRNDCVWANSLVDRIVSEPLEPAGAVTEPYAIWAIERQPGLRVPLTHRCIAVVDDLSRIERLKLFILNLGHTVLAERWHVDGRPPRETVRRIVADPAIRGYLDSIYDGEVLPVFLAAGLGEAPAYRDTIIDRFRNPFLDHHMAEIFKNHAAKKERRLGGIMQFAAESAPDVKQPRLAAMLASGVG